MFEYERVKASQQLSQRKITFKCSHGYYSPDKIQDRCTLVLAGYKKTGGDAAWFNELIDSEEFRKHFDTHTLIDHDDIAPMDTPPPSPLAERVWAAFN